MTCGTRVRLGLAVTMVLATGGGCGEAGPDLDRVDLFVSGVTAGDRAILVRIGGVVEGVEPEDPYQAFLGDPGEPTFLALVAESGRGLPVTPVRVARLLVPDGATAEAYAVTVVEVAMSSYDLRPAAELGAYQVTIGTRPD
ncbi:MAG TPA: hypothetical protein VGA02_11935 [Gemmatimonadales bacterium]